MNGRWIGVGLIGFALVFGGGLWWSQQYAWYSPVDAVDRVAVAGVEVPVAGYRGLDARSSPLKLRGCFRVDPSQVAGPPVAAPSPPVAPGWFECFDAEAIGVALERGEARAVLAETGADGLLTVVAVFPDGRGYLWRQFAEGAGG